MALFPMGGWVANFCNELMSRQEALLQSQLHQWRLKQKKKKPTQATEGCRICFPAKRYQCLRAYFGRCYSYCISLAISAPGFRIESDFQRSWCAVHLSALLSFPIYLIPMQDRTREYYRITGAFPDFRQKLPTVPPSNEQNSNLSRGLEMRLKVSKSFPFSSPPYIPIDRDKDRGRALTSARRPTPLWPNLFLCV